ncbi:MAG: riboflavin synthase [Chitinophagaceae bacterium]|nr:riboflavin synthase [Chitinophagaceae bacterium]
MFTGIIEATGKVVTKWQEGSNVHFAVESVISPELKVDQSVAHDGVCLTVVQTLGERHVVTAVEETLSRTNLNQLSEGDEINLERSMMLNGRLDGHLVQGHVDEVITCNKVKALDGSWLYTFSVGKKQRNLLVEKGSVCINGVSLTVVKADKKQFSVAIIPYTFENTSFKNIRKGSKVNIEYDIIGKYVLRMLGSR